MPEEFFSKMETVLVAQTEHDAEVVERAHGASALVSAAEVEHEAAGGLEHTPDRLGESQQPLDVRVLGFVAVLLLALERERRRGDYKINGLGRKQREQVERIAYMGCAPLRGVKWCGQRVTHVNTPPGRKPNSQEFSKAR